MPTAPDDAAAQRDGVELDHSRSVAISVAEAAGDMVRTAFGTVLETHAKQEGDVVTSLDVSAEQLIVERIHDSFPSHNIITEESGTLFPSSTPWTWLVDPLDGSNNITIGLPIVAIGLALCHRRRPLLGVVHEPFARRTLSAVHNRGTRDAQDRPLRTPHRPAARPTLVAWSQGYKVRRDDRRATQLRADLHYYANRILELWAPLTAWAMLARGEIDGFVGYKIGELDLLAGALVAEMAGVEIREFDGSPFDRRFAGMGESRSLVAAVPGKLGDLQAIVARAIGGQPVRGHHQRSSAATMSSAEIGCTPIR